MQNVDSSNTSIQVLRLQGSQSAHYKTYSVYTWSDTAKLQHFVCCCILQLLHLALISPRIFTLTLWVRVCCLR